MSCGFNMVTAAAQSAYSMEETIMNRIRDQTI